MDKAVKRLYSFIEEMNIKPASLEKECGIGNGYLRTMLKKDYGLGEDIVLKIKSRYPELSLEWLYCGTGPMTIDLASAEEGVKKEYPKELEIYLSRMYEDIIAKKDKEISDLSRENIRLKYELEKRRTISG